MTEAERVARDGKELAERLWSVIRFGRRANEMVVTLTFDMATKTATVLGTLAALHTEDEATASLREALEQIAIYGCGMLNQPAALNIPNEAWLIRRIEAYEKTARAALAHGERVG